MYTSRCYVSATMYDGLIYAVGGFDGRQRLQSAECYDVNANQWHKIASMNCVRSDAAIVAYDGRLFIAGGFTGKKR